jgi:hypothetical protein
LFGQRSCSKHKPYRHWLPAGYHQGNDPLPNPPVTRSVLEFRKKGMSDTQMLMAAVDWANKVPPSNKGELTPRQTLPACLGLLQGKGAT